MERARSSPKPMAAVGIRLFAGGDGLRRQERDGGRKKAARKTAEGPGRRERSERKRSGIRLGNTWAGAAGVGNRTTYRQQAMGRAGHKWLGTSRWAMERCGYRIRNVVRTREIHLDEIIELRKEKPASGSAG
jgi:hypothetical protein